MSPFWKDKSVLVTGATGFLGGWLIRSLLEQGTNVTALVRRNRQDSQLFLSGLDQQAKVIMGNVWDSKLLEQEAAGSRRPADKLAEGGGGIPGGSRVYHGS
jgi:uncharacterized protein YbjT (DUF2867 family)